MEKNKLLELGELNLLGLSSIFKGGPGSGNWNGPGDPRYAHEGKKDPKDFSGQNLRGRDLSYQDLIGYNLTDANLTGANLRYTDLTDANLTGANLRYTDLTDANLTGITLPNGNKISSEFVDALDINMEINKDFQLYSSQDNKIIVQDSIVEVTGIDENKVRESISQWAVTSGGRNLTSIANQLAVKEIFKLDSAKIDHWPKNKLVEANKLIDIDQKAILQAQYDLTQKYFKDKGIKEILVYRGVGDSYKGESLVGLQPISSFSLDYEIASNFGENVFAARVSVEKILSHPRTGFGCTSEKEVVVLGGELDVVKVNSVLDANALYIKKKDIGLGTFFKGGVGSGIRGHRTYRAQQPKNGKHWQDVSEQLDKNLLEIADGKAKRVLTQGQFNEKNIRSIINNMRNEADLYTSYLASDTAVKLRDMTSIYENILYEGLRSGEFKDINTKDLDDFGIDNIKKMVHQEVESNRQQFTDHGIRHIFGNTQRQIEIMEQMGKASAMDKLSAIAIMVNHDVGYTTAEVRKGDVEGIKASNDHKTFSGEIINSQRSILNEGKLFSSKQFDRVSEAIKTHDSAEFSKDNLLNSTRISDNLALFAKEKLPSMFKYVKGGAMDLVNMGEAAKNNDAKSFEVLRASLYKKIDASNLNVNLKRDLKAGVREISLMTPKFSMGTLAGEIDSISGGKGKVNVTIKYSKWDAFLQTRFDMGQKQTKKLLNGYGITDFSKTNYDIGGVINLKVVGVGKKDIGLSAIFKHLPGRHDQRTHAPGGFVNQDGRKVPKYDPQGTYPLYHNTPGMYLPSILRLGIGETDKYSPLRGTETLKHDSRTSWTRDSGYTSVAGQWTPDRARLTINNKQDLIKDGLSTEPAVASLATDMQADKFIPAYFEHEEAVYGIIKPSMISRIDITQVDYDKMLRDRKNFVEWGEKAKNKPVRVGKEEFDREMNKISYESNKRAVADLDLVLNDKRLVVGEIKPIYKILGLSSFTKAKSKITYSPVDKDKHEFQFRESTSKNEKKLQKIIQDFFEDQKKEVLGLLKKDFEEIEQKHLLGQHDQLSHGGGGKGSVDLQKEGAVYVYRGEYIGLKDKILKNGIPKKKLE